MGEQHLLAEDRGCNWPAACGARRRGAGSLSLHGDLCRKARKVAPARALLFGEDEWHEARARFDDRQAEAGGEIVTETGRTHLRDGGAAGGNDERCGADRAGSGLDEKGGIAADGEHACGEQEANAGGGALALEHGYNLLRGAVAEELAEGLLVVADAVLFDERDHVRGGETGECGAGEVRVRGEEVLRRAAEIGEVGAAAAGDEDFAPGTVGVVKQKDASTAAAGLHRAHHAGRAGTEDQDIGAQGDRADGGGHPRSVSRGVPLRAGCRFGRLVTGRGGSACDHDEMSRSEPRLSAAAPVLRVSRRAADRLRAGHLWVYRTEIETGAGVAADAAMSGEADAVAPGAVVTVTDARGLALGSAIYSSSSAIAARLVSREPGLTRVGYLALLRERVGAALALRDALAPPAEGSDGRRLLFSEADGVPGIIADQYGSLILVQMLTQATARDDVRAVLAEMLPAAAGEGEPVTIWERPDPRVRELEELGPSPAGPLFVTPGTEARSSAIFHLNGLALHYDAAAGQKTGAFLDQRVNYAAAAAHAHGRALDVCTYQGGFALHLARRCAQVTGVDSSRAALEIADRNLDLNREALAAEVDWIEADAFDLLRAWDGSGERFDTIVLDPPAFAKSRRATEGALRGYKELNLRALRMLRPGGTLVTCSCSHHVALETFLGTVQAAASDADRRVQLLEIRGAAPDHPAVLTLPETSYLKCLICRVA